MSKQLAVTSHELTEGATIRHRNLRTEHTVVEITDCVVRTVSEGKEYVYPRDQLALELSAGRSEVVTC
ncbi:hypothetical protein ACH9L7_15750 [Haloferax sp. S1W]|uniref:hypothetical protein n=1 Tax=Haloferax sp. S1W TaxID=3377110 RepID=UPI0037CA61C6